MTKDRDQSIKDFIDIIVGEISSEDISMCPICNEIPEQCYAYRISNQTWEDELPKAASQLKPFILFGHDNPIYSKEAYQILRCPNCGRLYTRSYHYEYGGGIGLSDGEINLARRTLKQIKIIVIKNVVYSPDYKNWWYYDSEGKLNKGIKY